MITIERYTPDAKREWDDFTATSRNATFLHRRDYMDYHSDRFTDCSLMARDDRGRLMAVMPACLLDDGLTLSSHAGLTWAGWLLPPRRCDALDMLDIFAALTDWCRAHGIRQLIYKASPTIYHRRPAEEDIYALYRAGAVIDRVLISSAIDLADPLPMDQGSRQRARRALNTPDIIIGPSDRWADFWAVLDTLLADRYDARPVHSLAEITLLQSRVPDNIRLYTATDRVTDELLGGIVVYADSQAVHSQYTAASPRGKALSVVPGIYARIIEDYSGRARWLDLGTSNEDGGRAVNAGLLRQKCSYGARGIAYNTFVLKI